MEALAEKYPFVTLRQLTVTPGGRPVTAVKLGTGEHTVFVSAAHHANEWITASLVLRFLEDYAAAIAEGKEIGGENGAVLAAESTLWAVPLVNPDGVDLVTGAATEGEVAAAEKLAVPFRQGGRRIFPGWT